jgi:dTDP-4-dehydrorhamnose 3,5-epimerase
VEPHLIDSSKIVDNRGYLSKVFHKDNQFFENFRVLQINVSKIKVKGTVKGFHLQPFPFEEIKIVNCLEGSIVDVVVDLRKDSKNFGKTYKFNLSSTLNQSLVVPPYFGHGLQSLENDTMVHYVHSNHYSKELEIGVNPLDKDLVGLWDLNPVNISQRDLSLPSLTKFMDSNL